MTNENPVKLSVVVVSTRSAASLERCLNSILANKNCEKIEIIVAATRTDKAISGLIKDFPAVRFIEFREKAGFSILAAAGIKKSAGEIIALIDSSSVVDKNWINSIIRAHQSPHTIIGGAVEPFGNMNPLDAAAYFCDYGRFMLPLEPGAADVLPGNNFSFKRAALNVGREFIAPEFWKTFWCQMLQNEGIELILAPEILIYSVKKFSLFPFLAERFYRGRCFAGMRVRSAAFSKRLLYGGGSIFLPAVFLYRAISLGIEKKRFGGEFIRPLPFISLAVLSWSLGEFRGYLAGTGKSCDYID